MWAKEEGHLDALTRVEKQVIWERYLSQQPMVKSYGLLERQLREDGGRQVTRESLQLANRSAVVKLVRVSRGEAPTAIGRKVVKVNIEEAVSLFGKGLHREGVADALGLSTDTLDNARRANKDKFAQLNIHRGRPRKNV